ncbi:N-acetylmuramoyl-L-alanine amidase [Peptostreptococcus porci]|uniref:N-acetylmuramoyl-L-alanine amidase family protein n=1 Tax=Peptostreptococcus porci TaxID=2652282 RepID=UPI002A911A6F|nr:N-acetylmuramoyl-L-alanine amidase [Peptostreptococcus porci]MDY5435750.1 N-acetylmuramoyl-L-alanine amidase [Peptostreptococcus porci]MDY6232764.1 N-acetylmuramoyl-L-alanine amidase [Peptostreptococcus porci]
MAKDTYNERNTKRGGKKRANSVRNVRRNSNRNQLKRKSKPSRRLNIKKLFFLVLVLFILIFCIYKVTSSFISKFRSDNSTKTVKTLSAEEIQKQKDNVINIMIDPAKGGNNEGLSTKNLKIPEKDINLDIAKLVSTNLSKYKDVNVILSREYDEDMPVKERAKLAKDNKVDIIVSIRLNAQANGDDANGIDTYYTDPKEKPSIVSDANEEKKDDNSSSDTTKKATATVDESKEEKREELSKKLAIKIQETTISFVKLRDRGVINQNYDILKYAEMPSVIIHAGFITNKSDSAILEDKEKLGYLADGISSGILDFVDTNRSDIKADRINYR